jgi:hypothetical protein
LVTVVGIVLVLLYFAMDLCFCTSIAQTAVREAFEVHLQDENALPSS